MIVALRPHGRQVLAQCVVLMDDGKADGAQAQGAVAALARHFPQACRIVLAYPGRRNAAAHWCDGTPGECRVVAVAGAWQAAWWLLRHGRSVHTVVLFSLVWPQVAAAAGHRRCFLFNRFGQWWRVGAKTLAESVRPGYETARACPGMRGVLRGIGLGLVGVRRSGEDALAYRVLVAGLPSQAVAEAMPQAHIGVSLPAEYALVRAQDTGLIMRALWRGARVAAVDEAGTWYRAEYATIGDGWRVLVRGMTRAAALAYACGYTMIMLVRAAFR